MLLTLFGTAMTVESIGNHMLFRTYGLDLGIYAQTAYDFGHLRVNDGTFYQWEPYSQLADHFDLLLALLGPLTWIVRADWLLLVVQLLAVLSGASGLYLLTRDVTSSERTSILAMLMMLCQFGVWHALGYDYHSNVVAACQLPWLLLFLRRRRLGAATAVLVLMAVSKETVALWLCFVLVALLWDYRRERRVRRWLVAATAATAAYFIAATQVVMPALGDRASTGFWRYSWMGATTGEVARWMATHPVEVLRDMFTDFTPAADSGRLKMEFFVCALTSGVLFCLARPNYLLMLVPPVAMKMLSSDVTSFWGIAYHYNIEVCMVGCCAAVAVLARPQLQSRNLRTGIMAAATILALTTTLYTIGKPLTPIRKANVNILEGGHYRQGDFDVATVRQALSMIPDDASVCAVTPFTPHLAARDSAYIFPMGLAHDTEYWLVLKDHWCYYEGERETAASMIADTAAYHTLLTDGTVYLLKKTAK